MIRLAFILLLAAFSLNSCMTGRAITLLGPKPKDLAECFVMLDSVVGPDKIKQIRAMTEEDFTTKKNFGLPRWMESNFWLWTEGELSRSFYTLGVPHVDDQTKVILTSYHRYLTNRPLAVSQQIESVIALRRALTLQTLIDRDSAGSSLVR